MAVLIVNDEPVRPVKVRPQTQRAKWRGEIKLQVELAPRPGATFLATSRRGAICAKLAATADLRRLLRRRPKAYFRAVMLGDGTLVILQEVPARDW